MALTVVFTTTDRSMVAGPRPTISMVSPGWQSLASSVSRGELKRHFRDHAWALHVPRGVKDRALQLNHELQASDNAGDTPSASELAERLELSERQILEAREAWLALEVDSLDRPVRGQQEWEPQPVPETIGSVDDDYELADQRFTIEAACRKLPVRERLVLHMRFIEDRTQTDIAATIGLSQMQVSRILRGAIERLELAAGPELEY